MGIVALVKRLIADALNSVSTAEVVVIQTVSDDHKYCSVMPKRLMHDGTNSPIIKHVPILYQRSGDSVILIPPKIGDVGLVITNKFALDTLLIDNGANPLNSSRQFSINDILYVGGLATEISSFPTIGDGEIIIYHASGAYIMVDATGNIEIKGKTIKMVDL